MLRLGYLVLFKKSTLCEKSFEEMSFKFQNALLSASSYSLQQFFEVISN